MLVRRVGEHVALDVFKDDVQVLPFNVSNLLDLLDDVISKGVLHQEVERDIRVV